MGYIDSDKARSVPGGARPWQKRLDFGGRWFMEGLRRAGFVKEI
jgi:hypothetical protein